MSYIWTNYDKNSFFKVDTNKISPYLEAEFSRDFSKKTVLVNIKYRVQDILIPPVWIKSQSNNETTIELTEMQLMNLYEYNPYYGDVGNIVLHYMAQLDLTRGITSLDLTCYLEELNILNGCYGTTVKDAFSSFCEKDKNIILSNLVSYNKNNQREVQFFTVLLDLFQSVTQYFEESTEITHFYINKPNTKYNNSLLQVVEHLLKPLTATIEVMWERECFGLIELDNTMIIDKIAIVN